MHPGGGGEREEEEEEEWKCVMICPHRATAGELAERLAAAHEHGAMVCGVSVEATHHHNGQDDDKNNQVETQHL